MFPTVRMRRYRKTSWMRDLIARTTLLPKDLIQPFFIIEGSQKREAIDTMPGIYRLSIDLLVEQVLEAEKLGIKAIALFPSIDTELKCSEGKEAYNEDNLLCRAVRAIKAKTQNIGIICDVALDPYTDHGHDGIIKFGDVDNDETIEKLQMQALALAKSGSDIIAPSDMMDGRIMMIRDYLDEHGFENVSLLSYAMKYASNLYGPFRNAVGSKVSPSGFNKATYQADFRSNIKQAFQECELDTIEGADMLMIKPAGMYLDVISHVSEAENIPVFAYQVSGEYAMLKFASNAGAIKWHETMIESLVAIKRAGATAILTYAAMEIATIINHN
jgi:porphobilinogen synthase